MLLFKDIRLMKDVLNQVAENIQRQVNADLNDVQNTINSKKALEREVTKLKLELAELKHRKKLEEEDLKHMVRMKEESLVIDFEKKVLEVTQQKDSEVAEVKDEYRDKIELRLEQEGKNIKEMYNEILQRLPNVNVALGSGFDQNLNINKTIKKEG